ncbi:MAG TPA: hypothetical protein VF211_14020 [Burkholderiales bacterium]
MSAAARALVLLALPLAAAAQEPGTHEMIGQLGSRAALLTLHATRNPDRSWQLAGEYVILPTLQRRFVEGEASAELGVATLREGDTPILFGRGSTAELRGVWRDGSFRGTRYAPGGQERERFEFSEDFPSLEGYSATVRCELGGRHDGATLEYAVSAGRVQSFAWQSRRAGKSCRVAGLVQEPMRGGILLAAPGCRVTLRDLGEALRVNAESCQAQCEAPARLEPLLVDRRGNCRPFRAEVRR